MALSPKSEGIISAQTGHCALHCKHAACNKQHETDTVQLLSADQPMCLALRRAHAVWHKPLPQPVGSCGPRSCAAPAQCADHSAIHVGRSHDERRVGRSRAAHGSEPHGQLGGSRGRRGAHCCNGDEPCRRCAAASSAESDGKHGLGPTKPRCRCGRGEFIPGAERAGVSPVPEQMWQGGEPSSVVVPRVAHRSRDCIVCLSASALNDLRSAKIGATPEHSAHGTVAMFSLAQSLS